MSPKLKRHHNCNVINTEISQQKNLKGNKTELSPKLKFRQTQKVTKTDTSLKLKFHHN